MVDAVFGEHKILHDEHAGMDTVAPRINQDDQIAEGRRAGDRPVIGGKNSPAVGAVEEIGVREDAKKIQGGKETILPGGTGIRPVVRKGVKPQPRKGREGGGNPAGTQRSQNPETMAVSGGPARPAWVSHADKSLERVFHSYRHYTDARIPGLTNFAMIAFEADCGGSIARGALQ